MRFEGRGEVTDLSAKLPSWPVLLGSSARSQRFVLNCGPRLLLGVVGWCRVGFRKTALLASFARQSSTKPEVRAKFRSLPTVSRSIRLPEIGSTHPQRCTFRPPGAGLLNRRSPELCQRQPDQPLTMRRHPRWPHCTKCAHRTDGRSRATLGEWPCRPLAAWRRAPPCGGS